MPAIFIFLLTLLFSQTLSGNSLAESRTDPLSPPTSSTFFPDDLGYSGLEDALKKAVAITKKKLNRSLNFAANAFQVMK